MTSLEMVALDFNSCMFRLFMWRSCRSGSGFMDTSSSSEQPAVTYGALPAVLNPLMPHEADESDRPDESEPARPDEPDRPDESTEMSPCEDVLESDCRAVCGIGGCVDNPMLQQCDIEMARLSSSDRGTRVAVSSHCL